MRFPKMTEWAHDLIKRYVVAGDVVVDATAGNGHDTIFLANLVGDTGKVYAFDIQEEALRMSRQRIEGAGHTNVSFILDTHEHIQKYVTEHVKAVIFNLGYLPGSDKKITTTAQASLVAIQKSLQLVSTGGLVLVVVYPGHAEGRRESEVIDEWITSLDEEQYHVLKIQYVNRTIHPPYILAIHRVR